MEPNQRVFLNAAQPVFRIFKVFQNSVSIQPENDVFKQLLKQCPGSRAIVSAAIFQQGMQLWF